MATHYFAQMYRTDTNNHDPQIGGKNEHNFTLNEQIEVVYPRLIGLINKKLSGM